MKIEKLFDTEVEIYNPEGDGTAIEITDTRVPQVSISQIRLIMQNRDFQRKENVKRLLILPQIYGGSDDGGGPGF